MTSNSLSGYCCVLAGRRHHDGALDTLAEFEHAAQGRIFHRLRHVEHGRFALGRATVLVAQEQFDLFVGNDVAHILRIGDGGERQADHLVAGNHGAAAIARINRRIDLDAQARHGIVVMHEFDARDDAFGNRQANCRPADSHRPSRRRARRARHWRAAWVYAYRKNCRRRPSARPGPCLREMASTVADNLSPEPLAWICTWLA